MMHMLANNEDAHLATVVNTERERLEREIMKSDATPVSPPPRSGRALPAVARPDRRVNAPQAQAPRDVGSSMEMSMARITSAPKTAQSSTPQQHDSGTPGASSKTIKGEMKLISNGGGEIGTVQMDAELT
jgi:hypothetical protein